MESSSSNASLLNVPREADQVPSAGWQVVLFVGVFLSLMLYATWRTPIPGTNEPHYLTKARVFWDPTWCARDPFLQSTPAHVVFYTLLGGPAVWWGFPAAAWIGRILGWAGLAWGWTKCSRALSLSNLAAMTALWIYLCLAAVGNFSGEWMVGGTEGKVFSYGAVLLSLAAVMEGRTIAAGAWGGVAVAFHPVVGAWHAIALFVIFFIDLMPRVRSLEDPFPRRVWLGILAWGVVSLPGLIPAVFLLQHHSKQDRGAEEVQVFERLAHHLDPATFPMSSYLGYGVLLAVFLLLWRLGPKDRNWGFVRWYVIMSLCIAAMGLLLRFQGPANGFNPTAALKLYPFRMFDIFLPLVVAMLAAKILAPRRIGGKIAEGVVCGVLIGVGTFVIPADRDPSHLPLEMWNDWKTTCAWIKEKTPKEALFLTSNRGFAFKWYAERAEYFSYKDCPQDLGGITDWNHRRYQLWAWFHEGFFEPELRKLRKETGCDYLVLTRGTPCHLHPVYHNDSFVVYQIPAEWK